MYIENLREIKADTEMALRVVKSRISTLRQQVENEEGDVDDALNTLRKWDGREAVLRDSISKIESIIENYSKHF